MLVRLPDLVFPITGRQADALMENVVKLNVLDAGIAERTQKALDLEFHIHEVKADTGGTVDYSGHGGHARLLQDAMTLVGDGSPLVTRHGDLKAAFLAIAFNDCQAKLAKAGMPLLTKDVNLLINQVRDLLNFPNRTEDRMGLFLSYLRKKPPV